MAQQLSMLCACQKAQARFPSVHSESSQTLALRMSHPLLASKGSCTISTHMQVIYPPPHTLLHF